MPKHGCSGEQQGRVTETGWYCLIRTGRQPVPQQTMYGAYLYAHTLRSPGISCSPLSCVDALLTLLRQALLGVFPFTPCTSLHRFCFYGSESVMRSTRCSRSAWRLGGK